MVLSDLSLSAPPAANSITEYAASTLGGAVPGVNRPLPSTGGLTVRAEGGILSRLYRIHPQETTWRPQWQ